MEPSDLIPESWTPWIIAVKGCFAFVGVLLLLWHMNREWPGLYGRDQRMRYLTFLAYGVLQAGASGEQYSQHIALEWRHVGGFIVSIMFFTASLVSLRWSFKNQTRV
jgi:hypothetical protein